MMERPFIFSTEMVKAILEHRKSQTRRPLRPQPVFGEVAGAWTWHYNRKNALLFYEGREPPFYAPLIEHCPYGQVGDRLWVRETYTIHSGGLPGYKEDCSPDFIKHIRYDTGWKSPIHMPRWASQITLEITGLRVEKLQEITEEDANNEGFAVILGNMDRPSARWYFRNYWDSLNAKKGFGWESDPWCWVLEFKEFPNG